MKPEKDFFDQVKFEWFKNFFWLALAGAACFLFSFFVDDERLDTALGLGGLLLLMPFMLHFYVLSVWHWGVRYRGKHKLLWGFVLLIETSGWFKIWYFFRHIWPDYKRRGRYHWRENVPMATHSQAGIESHV